MAGNQPTTLERIERVQTVRGLLISGKDRSEIIQYCSNLYNVTTDRCIDGYIADAKKIIKEDFERCFDAEGFKSEVYSRYQDLYAKNYALEDYKECRNIIADMNKLLGLNAPKKMELEVSELSPEERQRRLDELKRKLG